MIQQALSSHPRRAQEDEIVAPQLRGRAQGVSSVSYPTQPHVFSLASFLSLVRVQSGATNACHGRYLWPSIISPRRPAGGRPDERKPGTCAFRRRPFSTPTSVLVTRSRYGHACQHQAMNGFPSEKSCCRDSWRAHARGSNRSTSGCGGSYERPKARASGSSTPMIRPRRSPAGRTATGRESSLGWVTCSTSFPDEGRFLPLNAVWRKRRCYCSVPSLHVWREDFGVAINKRRRENHCYYRVWGRT